MRWGELLLVFLAGLGVVLAGCRRVEDGAELRKNLEEQSDELKRVKTYLAKTRVKLKEIAVNRALHAEVATIRAELAAIAETVESLQSELAELEGERAVSEYDLSKLVARQRVKVRREWEGESLDLSATMGEGYEEVRVFAVLPIGIKIQLSSGAETVPFDKIPEAVRELFLMSKEEVLAYRERIGNSAQGRAVASQGWKREQSKRGRAEAKSAALKRVEEVSAKIASIERQISARWDEVKELKSKASTWELKSARVIGSGKKSRAIRYALVYREKAQEIVDGNDRAWKVVAGLQNELADLKKAVVAAESSGR